MKQFRITFLTDRMIKGHGVDLVVDRIADGLAKKGYLTEVYANQVDETFTNRKSYKIYRLPPLGTGNFLALERRVRKFADFLNSRSTDLFIIQSFPFYSLIPKLKTPSIVVDHGVPTSEGLPLKRRIFLKYLQISQNLSYFRKAVSVICVSDYLLKQLPDYIRKKATFIYNGIDHYHSDHLKQEDVLKFREDFGIKPDEVLLLYVGRLNLSNQPYKGLAELVGIYQQVQLEDPKIRLMAVGYGSKNDAELLKNQGVLCIANAPEKMMPLFYSASDIYTTCSKWEGFDLPVGESQYFGKPVICYDIGAHPEVLIDGKTGFIVSDRDEFAEKIKLLASNHELRKTVGDNARDFVKKFYWQNSIDSYEKEISKILQALPQKKPAVKDIKPAEPLPCLKNEEEPARQPEPVPYMPEEESKILEALESTLNKKVSVLIVNYNSSIPCMRECLDSLKNQSYDNFEIIIFDNDSSNNTLDVIRRDNLQVRIIKSDKNVGLGEAINQSLKYIDSTYILISNFDTTYDKIAIEELVESIENLPGNYVGLAPKIKLFYQRDYLESAGVYIDNNFYLGYNGIGQLDLDQYNKQEDVFGVSFTSAFIKKDYLCQSVIGAIDKPIDPTFFHFYEDIDFCYRANLLGYRFKSCPTAICYHKYAYSFRDEATAFTTKYYYQKLNAMKLAYKNAEAQNMKRVIKNELAIQKQNLKDRNLKSTAKRIISDWRASRHYLKKQRPYIQITRQIPDSEIIKFSWGEKNFFDIVNNEPVYCIENLLLTYKRLFVITGNRKYEEYIQYLEALNDTRFKIEVPLMKSFLHSKLEYEPSSIHHLIDRIR